eukprot:7873852-Pyramimonas_sp.AAC.1
MVQSERRDAIGRRFHGPIGTWRDRSATPRLAGAPTTQSDRGVTGAPRRIWSALPRRYSVPLRLVPRPSTRRAQPTLAT